MQHKEKGPADVNRWAFYKLKGNFFIVPCLHRETQRFVPQLAAVYGDAATSEGQRAIRLGCGSMRRNFRNASQLEGK
jgi:hypothetical protein